MTAADARLLKLKTLSPAELRAMWRDCWRKPAPDIGPDLLRRGIAWKLQTRIHGELPLHVRREIDGVLRRLESGKSAINHERASFKPGTRLVREWRGTLHQIVVLESGYEHDGRHYTSLTQVASAITGVHWSGPKFFGLRSRRAPMKP